MEISIEQLQTALPGLPLHLAEKYVDDLNAALVEFEITTPPRVAAFIAQIGHESGNLRYWREIWGPTPQQKKYEPPSAVARRLGNTHAGDGSRYRGRGPIQITGRSNYERFGEKLGLDLINNPELLEDSPHGFRAAGCFWQLKGLNELADEDTNKAFEEITRKINGGLNGWEDRFTRWERARKVFGLQ